ncbi:MAG: DUF1499 domain-containing protein [Pseudomonadota bacterium]
MKWLVILLLVLVVFGVAVAIYARSYAIDAAALHVEPADVTPPSSPNFALAAGDTARTNIGDLAETAALLDQEIGRLNGARIAGDLAQGHATYVFRSRFFGFPDVMSIRLREGVGSGDSFARPEGETITYVDLYSRALMGFSDLGVNQRRLDRLTEPLRP